MTRRPSALPAAGLYFLPEVEFHEFVLLECTYSSTLSLVDVERNVMKKPYAVDGLRLYTLLDLTLRS